MIPTPHLDELRRLHDLTETYAKEHEPELRVEQAALLEARKEAQQRAAIIAPSLRVVNGSTEEPSEDNEGTPP